VYLVMCDGGVAVLFHLVLYRACMVVLDTLLVSGFV